LEERDREKQRRKRKERIEESKYNKWGEGVPGDLKKGWGESRWKRVARFRLGSEVKKGRYWEDEERRKCRLCENEEETWKYVWERCRRWREGGGGWQEGVGWVLGEDGKKERWMREIEGKKMGVDRTGGI